MRLEGRVALITGAGGGIGRATALRLAEEGSDLALADVNPALMAETATLVRHKTGRRVVEATVDVTQVAQLGTAVDRVVAELGQLDVLVNNAGVQHIAPFAEVTEADYDRILAINLKAVFFAMQAAARVMMPRRSGRIVNLSSTAGRVPVPNCMAYGAAKMGVISLTQSAAIALAPFNINVNAICPGFVPTLMADEIGRGYLKHFGITKEQRIEQQIQGAPFKRLQQPEDIAATIAFLASDDAREITGVTLNVNGGMSINM
jgi:NAD(P)-dependent dehydrogenase (short-subunit alcohol dehydrogenase family)